jgi:hypothetical protein
MANVLIKKQTGVPGYNPNLWGVSTKNPIAEVFMLGPQSNNVSINGKDFISRVDIVEQLPFKVTFIQVTSENYTRGNVAPIGIAIIGYSNYIA